MEVTLQELIESIKKDGVESAEIKAEEIIGKAEEKAADIVAAAKDEAERILADARREAVMKERGSIASIRQAGRDLLLSLQKEIVALFDHLLARRISKSMQKDDLLADLIKSVITSAAAVSDGAELKIPEKNFAGVKKLLFADAAEQLAKGYELKPVKGLQAGFRIEEKDGSGYYQVTPELISEMIGKFIGPDLKKLLSSAADEGA